MHWVCLSFSHSLFVILVYCLCALQYPLYCMSNCICILVQFTQSNIIYLAEILRCSSISLAFIWRIFFVSKLNNKSEKGRGIYFWLWFTLLTCSQHNETNEEWTEYDAHLFINVSLKWSFTSIKITKNKNNERRRKRKMWNKFLDCTRLRGSVLFHSVTFLILRWRLFSLPLMYCRRRRRFFVGIQITTIFNTIPKLECFRYVYLVVLSCVLKTKSSIFRFVVIGIMNGGFVTM